MKVQGWWVFSLGKDFKYHDYYTQKGEFSCEKLLKQIAENSTRKNVPLVYGNFSFYMRIASWIIHIKKLGQAREDIGLILKGTTGHIF